AGWPASSGPAAARQTYRSAVATAEPPAPPEDAFASLLAGDEEGPGIPDVQWITPAPPRKRRRWLGLTITLVVVLALVGGGTWAWNAYSPQLSHLFGTDAPADYAAGKAHGEAIVTINDGDIPSTISATLYKSGVTKSSNVFYQMLLTAGQSPTFYPGVYRLQKEMTAGAALKALQDPKNKLDHSVVLPEGLTASQILERVSKGIDMPLADLQAAAKNPKDYGVDATSLEGWLFPALYTFNPGTTAHDVIKAMVDRMKQELSDAGVATADQQQILTVASIVQREARQTGDFYKVARVIRNRLAQGMKLQMDSTAQYGYGSLHNGTASSSGAALSDPNGWNTYVHTGLPQGPISSPGDTAIDAALHPAPGGWLYFTTVNMTTGETVFSTSYADHEKAVAQMQSWCRANPNTGC
ncbi:MAG TPA: endolytic transglycosylase MltG, partial [Microbacterium sp.]|nr:endolytic transglycosylase MltG [Microbacterium sp.]